MTHKLSGCYDPLVVSFPTESTFLMGLWLWAMAHPILTGLIGGAVVLLALWSLRKVASMGARFIWTVASAPFVTGWRIIRKRRIKAGRGSDRLPMVGEIAFMGPCSRACGSKHQRKVTVTAYHSGTLRGYDLRTGRQVLGCPDCVSAV